MNHDTPCPHCPWLEPPAHHTWTREHFHDLRLHLLRQNAAMPCLSSSHAGRHCAAATEVSHPTQPTQQPLLFPSFEAMADSNGAGLYDWVTQLQAGDAVVHFQHDQPKLVLEVQCNTDGVVLAYGEHRPYRFNNLGFELHTMANSRILPATAATLEVLRRHARVLGA